MIARWHFLTGEYPPARGGIAQFAAVAAEALASRGADVHVWTPGGGAPAASTTVHRLPDRFGEQSIAALEEGVRAMPGRVVLHYAPNVLGARGANLRFCRWFARQGQHRWDARVLFHEPYLYFGRQSPARNALAVVHRVMASTLLRANHEVYLSTPSWQPLLERYSAGPHQWTWIPITAGSLRPATPEAAARARATLAPDAARVVGTFGTYADEIAGLLRVAIARTLDACAGARVVCFGEHSREFVASLPDRSRVSAAGELPEDELNAAVSACDVMLQPFPEGVTCRRTSLLRSLACGAAVVTTSGSYTEAIWRASGAVLLAPADNPEWLAHACAALLADPAERVRLGEAARQLYESSFSPSALLAALDSTERAQTVLVGTHTFAASGTPAVRQKAAMLSLGDLRRTQAVSLEHAGSRMTPPVSGVEYLPVLHQDSVQLTGTPGTRKAIASEVFGELAARAAAAGSRYFLYANGDVRLSQPVIDRVLRGDRLAYLFWRTDEDADGSNAGLMAEGIDAFAVDARWYAANAWRFRPYIIGERTWDNVYAAILGAEADAAFIAEPGWLRHERHERAWLDSPFHSYVRYLSALDHEYFSLWCQFWDRVRDRVQRGASDEIDAIAAEAFRRRPRRGRRAVQWGRRAKALIRYRIGRT